MLHEKVPDDTRELFVVAVNVAELKRPAEAYSNLLISFKWFNPVFTIGY